MKVLVFGADGRTGRELVPLLKKDHYVTQFKGDILDAHKVDKAVEHADAIISVVGHIKGSQPDFQTRGTKNIVESMKRHKKKRIITLTGTGVRFDKDKITFMDRILNAAILLIDPNRVHDGTHHVNILKHSGLDWTVVRVLKLTNGPASKTWKLTEHGPVQPFSTRKNTAQAICQVLNNGDFIKKAPMVSYLFHH